MDNKQKQVLTEICQKNNNDRTQLMNIVIAVQKEFGGIPGEMMDAIAALVSARRVEVESVISFYSFLSKKIKGKAIIRVCNDVVDRMQGADDVVAAFEQALGISAGETTQDGAITLEKIPCIGMCDQAPAALINDIVVPSLSADKAKEIVAELKASGDPTKISCTLGDGNNAADLVKSAVNNNIRKEGEVIFGVHDADSGLKKAVSLSPEEVVQEIKTARLRGRGGAGFPTGMKWEFTRGAQGDQKYVLCNADEGEPGTFKDRVLLTEKYDLLFEGMAIAGYAIGADTGVLYLRGEYAYLRNLLEKKLQDRREKGLLGKAVAGKKGFDFDIRIQSGAGAYICGEETALISSCEGLRGDPKTRPPFPAQKGYLEKPTTVNNVETFCCVSRILAQGAGWFAGLGSKGSPGTKLLSVSGDCANPGVYELPFGLSLTELLKEVGAENTQAILMGGPSGQFVGPDNFNYTVCYDDVATGGAVVIFNKDRNLLDIVDQYMDFFVEESCGYCTPCRVGNVLMKNRLEEIMAGKGELSDLEYLQKLGESVKITSRCGLGQTSPNPILSTLKNFRSLYEAAVSKEASGELLTFDVKAALSEAEGISGRESALF